MQSVATSKIKKVSQQTSDRIIYYVAAAAILIALVLSIVSWMKLCSQACAAGHSYRLYGLTFETVGFIFFPLLLAAHLLSHRIAALGTLAGWMLCSALGSELMFIYMQKYKIGSWCPICLTIAFVLSLAGVAYAYGFYSNFKRSLESGDKGKIMNDICKGLTGGLIFIIGFIIAFVGIAKPDPLKAEENSLKESIAFGNLNSPIDVFIFTDWRCPSCRKLEPRLESVLPKIMRMARVTFVDDPVHPETMNYTPYNVSFMVNNKKMYFILRRALTEISEDNKSPSEQQIIAIATKAGTTYQQLNYADVALANKYFGELVEKMEIEGTPTVVVYNRVTKKSQKLEGSGEITEEGLLKAIETLSKPK